MSATATDVSIRWSVLPHLHRHLADEILLAPVSSTMGEPIRLNASGAQIWDSLLGTASINEVAHQLDSRVDLARRTADVSVLFEQLEANGLVTSGPQAMSGGRTATPRPSPRRHYPDLATGPLWRTLASIPPEHGPLHADRDLTDDLIQLIERRGSVGQLAHAIDLGRIRSSSEHRQLVQERWAANQLHCLRVEQMLLSALDLFDAAGIPYRLLKGVAVSHLDYPDPSWREFGDADVLVAEDAWREAVEVLEADSLFSPFHGEVVNPFGKGKGRTFLTPDKLMLDVHWRLSIGGLGARRVDVLFDNPDAFSLAGRSVPALSRPGRLVHALVHWFCTTAIRRGTMRDMTELADANPAEVSAIASHLRVSGVVQRSAGLLGEELELPALMSLAGSLRPTVAERVLAARWGDFSLHRNVLWREATGLLFTPGLRARRDYVTARVLPSAEFRQSNAVTWRTYAKVLTGREVK